MTVVPPIVVILGPTASGKSELAMAVARKLGAQILSVDSMQVYRGMDIGTAKPTRQERSQLPHHLIDVVDPSESFTVARFVEMADAVISEARQRGIVVSGGTPLYYKALFEGLFEGPGSDESVRRRLGAMSNEDLYRQLSEADPQAAARIHPNDTKRMIRALEVHHITGRPISSFQTHWEAGAMRHQAVWFGLAWDREQLNRRINARVKAMIASGWVEETRSLLERYGELSPTAAEATGYRELIAHLRGQLSLEDAIERIKIATRQLARRQMKWFRRWKQVQWLDGTESLEAKVSHVIESAAVL